MILRHAYLSILVAISFASGTLSCDFDDGADEVVPEVSKASPSPPGETSLTEACLRATACQMKPYPRVSNCRQNYTELLVKIGLSPIYDAIYRCTNQAESCIEVRQCFGVGEMCDSTFQAQCAEGKALFCDLIAKTTFVYDCGAAGMICQLDPKYRFAATCVPGSGPPLPSAAYRELRCESGSCQRTGESCPEDALDRCAKAKLQTCLDGEWIHFDCAALGLGPCQSMDGGWARCSGM